MFHWSKLIAGVQDETFGIPADVVFEIVENDELHEIKAHKWLLAMVSLPFKTMFYTTEVGNKAAETFKIEQTTAPAFQIMMDAIYETKSIEDSLKGKSVQEVFDVLHLIEQYQISELAEAVQEILANYPVDDDTVMEVAEEATEYTTLFQKEAKLLLLNCAKFLEPKFKDSKNIYRYAAKTDKKEVFSTLLAMMDEIQPVQDKKCSNCGYENCRDGNTIGEDEFREGLIVTPNRANDLWAVGVL